MSSTGPMPLAKASVPHNRKRQLIEVEPRTGSPPQPTAKRQKLEDNQRHQTPPSSFWDNLSRQWLTRRALREFDRRTVWPATPVPPSRAGKENINLAKLKRFARHGGPGLSDLRDYPGPEIPASSHPTMDLSQPGSRKRAKTGRRSGTSCSTRRTSAYDPAFEQHLHDHGIYMTNFAQRPSNWAEINERLAQPRQSLSPSQFTDTAFEAFQQTSKNALTESKVMSKAFPIIAGTADIPSQENLRFVNLKDLTDGSITKAQPDFYDGAHPEELNKQIREELGPYVLPSTNTAAPCLPNFFTEGKGPKGLTDVCENQAIYNGALGARGIHELRSYIGQETVFDNKAYTITSAYHHSGILTMYTTHPTLSEGSTNPIEYRTTQLNGWCMTGNPDTFRQGASALRNARDWAEEKRKELIAAANGKIPNTEHSDLASSTQSFVSLSSNKFTNLDSETSADEPLDIGLRASLMQGTLGRARPNRLAKALSKRRSKKSAFGVIKRSHTSSRRAQVI